MLIASSGRGHNELGWLCKTALTGCSGQNALK